MLSLVAVYCQEKLPKILKKLSITVWAKPSPKYITKS